MIRPPFRPPLSHEPGTSADPATRSRDHATPAQPPAAAHRCCGRPGCCEPAGHGDHGATRANSPDLNSVAPAPSPPKRGPAAPKRAHSN